MKPKTIVSVLDSLPAAKDVALRRALALAHWYESDLHVLHVGPRNSVDENSPGSVTDELAKRITGVAEGSGTGGVNIIPVVLSGRPAPP